MKVAFLDRDGVINKDTGYLYQTDQCIFLPKIFSGARELKRLGYQLIVVTNQSGIARGLFTIEDYEVLSHYIEQKFRDEQCDLLASYFCPHHPDATILEYKKKCQCRKPNNGMLLEAGQKYSIDFSKSILIGDSERDILAGIESSLAKTFLISNDEKVETKASYTCRNLEQIARLMA